ncbi:MAG: thiol:disulfide interchange protein DsbA [Paraglaciecola sp.]|jgi:thiol:disulfide interchange protein DsbA
MRQSFFIVFLLLTSFSTFNSLAQVKWQENTHYKVIAEKASAKPKVQEIFSYWCPACNAFETIVPQIKNALPAGIPFEKIHVNFNGSTTKQTQNDATTVMLAAKALKKDVQFNKALFNAIHQQRTPITSKSDILAVYARTGADVAKLEKMMTSFGIRSQVAKNDRIARTVRSVPTIIINEKYQATFTRDMTPAQSVELISWLVKQK